MAHDFEHHMIVDDSDTDTENAVELAWMQPATPEEVTELLAQPEADMDGRSPWMWVRLRDGSLMLATFPAGETYMRFSDAGVCDFGEGR
jgi:hypothetical protein